jgi:hypothetical protein
MFIDIMRSNSITVPRNSISDIIDEEWATIDTEALIHYSANAVTDQPRFAGSSENSDRKKSFKKSLKNLTIGSSDFTVGNSSDLQKE